MKMHISPVFELDKALIDLMRIFIAAPGNTKDEMAMESILI